MRKITLLLSLFLALYTVKGNTDFGKSLNKLKEQTENFAKDPVLKNATL